MLKKFAITLFGILLLNGPLLMSEDFKDSWEKLSEEMIIEQDGNNINIYHPKDAISHTRHLIDNQFISMLHDSYDGLQNQAKLDTLLQNQNYVEILNHVWTEDNLDLRIKWLEDKSNEGHPILMAELGYAYFLKSPTLETYVKKTIPWLFIAKNRIEIDCFCTSDKSTFGALSYIENYQSAIEPNLLEQYSSSEMHKYYNDHTAECNKIRFTHQKPILSSFLDNRILKMPSPQWVFFHGMAAFSKEENTILDTQWNQIRREVALEMLNNIKKHEISPH